MLLPYVTLSLALFVPLSTWPTSFPIQCPDWNRSSKFHEMMRNWCLSTKCAKKSCEIISPMVLIALAVDLTSQHCLRSLWSQTLLYLIRLRHQEPPEGQWLVVIEAQVTSQLVDWLLCILYTVHVYPCQHIPAAHVVIVSKHWPVSVTHTPTGLHWTFRLY